MIDGDLDVNVETRAPALDLMVKNNVLRPSRAEEQSDLAVARPFAQQSIERRPQRRHAEPARNQHNIPALGRRHRPANSEGSAHADGMTGAKIGQGARDGTHGADCMDQAWRRGIAAHADRRLADAKGREHVELTRRILEMTAVSHLQFEGPGVGRVVTAPADVSNSRNHRLRSYRFETIRHAHCRDRGTECASYADGRSRWASGAS